MSYRKVLVPVFGTVHDRSALDAAFAVGKQFGAHVEALFIRTDPVRAVPYGYLGGDISGYSAQYAIEAAIKANDAAQKIATECFKSAVEKHAIEITAKPGARNTPTAVMKIAQGDFAEEIETASRLCDLIVFGSAGIADGQETVREGFEAALLSGSRPVLFVQRSPSEAPGQRVAIAFDGSAAAAHAVTASVPFLSRAKAVHSFEITEATGKSPALTELHEYLALRGIDVVEHLVDAGPKPIGEALALSVEAQRCDLLVLGGYGHSRIREFVLGGVTRYLLRQGASFAILMTH